MRNWGGGKEKNPIYSTSDYYVCVHGAFAVATCVHIINYTPPRRDGGKTWKRKCLLLIDFEIIIFRREPTVA